MADDYERLLVLIEARIDQFEKAMVAAERRGTTTYQKLQSGAQKATTAVQARVNAMAQTQSRAMDQIAGKTEAAAERSAKGYAAWWREMERSRSGLDQLRASVDQNFAAQLRYDQAVGQLNDALNRNIITETEHRQILDQVSAAYLRGGQAAGAHGGALGALGSMSDATKAKLQNAGFQVQDVAVQMMAGTDASRALAMQLPQLLGGFGLIGVVLGTLASIGLPLLASMFGEAEGKAKDFGAAMGEVKNSIAAMSEQAAIYTSEGLVALKEKYGEVNAELRRHIDLLTEAAQRQALTDTRDAMAALVDETESWNGSLQRGLSDIFPGIAGQVNHLAAAMQEIQAARTFDEQLAAATRLKEMILRLTGGIDAMTDEQFKFFVKVQDSEDALRQLVATQPKQGWLEYAIGQAATLAGNLWDAARANAAIAADPGQTTGNLDWAKNELGFVMPGSELIYTPPKTGRGGRGGGGGGGRDERSGKIDALVTELQTEREIIEAWYAESLELLNGATEAELAAIGGRHEAMERMEAEHQERLRGIRDEAQTGTLAMAESFLGAMATLFAAGGGKAERAARAFAAAEALINTYRAQAQVLADPKLSFWQKFPAVAAVGAAGLKLVSAIKSGGGGSGGGGGGKTAASSASGGDGGGSGGNTPLRASIEALDPAGLYTGAAIRKVLDGLMEEAGNRGLILGWRA